MATRTAIDLKTADDVEIDIDGQEDDSGFGFWPPSYLNFWHHLRRIDPSAMAYMLPRQSGDPFGMYRAKEGRIEVYGRPHIYEQATLFHEVWHYAEHRLLSAADRDAVYGEVRKADRWCSDYLDSPSEQAARAFEHYASARAHGLQIAAAKKGTAQEVFQRIYEGRAHDECEKRRRREGLRPLMEWGWVLALGVGFFGLFFYALPHLVAH